MSVTLSINLSFDKADLARFRKATGRLKRFIQIEVPRRVGEIARDALRRVKQLTPGTRLPQGWDIEKTRLLEGVAWDISHDEATTKEGVDKLLAIEFGARPHPIFPRHAKVLRFEKEGEVKFRPMVNHPGNRAFAMVRRTTAEAQAAMLRELRVIANDAAAIWRSA